MVVVQHDDGPVLGGEGAEGTIEQLSITDRPHLVTGRSFRRANGLHSRHRSALRAGLRVAGMDDQTMEPRFEAFRLTQRRQVAPCTQERLLRGVLGAMVIAKDAVGEAVAAIHVGPDKRREGVAIASARPLHEVDLHG